MASTDAFNILQKRLAISLWYSGNRAVAAAVGEASPMTYEERAAAYGTLDKSIREGFEYAAETYLEGAIPIIISEAKARGTL